MQMTDMKKIKWHIIVVNVVFVTINDLEMLCLCEMLPSDLRNRSPARAVTRAFVLAISSPDTSTVTVGKSRTSKPPFEMNRS